MRRGAGRRSRTRWAGGRISPWPTGRRRESGIDRVIGPERLRHRRAGRGTVRGRGRLLARALRQQWQRHRRRSDPRRPHLSRSRAGRAGDRPPLARRSGRKLRTSRPGPWNKPPPAGRSVQRAGGAAPAARAGRLAELCGGDPERVTGAMVAQAAEEGDLLACAVLDRAVRGMARGLAHAVTLLAPRRVILGGGVSLMNPRLWIDPIRAALDQLVFAPFRGHYDVVLAALGEEVVVQGALGLARDTADGVSGSWTMRPAHAVTRRRAGSDRRWKEIRRGVSLFWTIDQFPISGNMCMFLPEAWARLRLTGSRLPSKDQRG